MDKEILRARLVFGCIITGLFILFTISLFHSVRHEYEAAVVYAQREAWGSYNKDLLFRRWASMHGGVYVPVTDSTPPNPYLQYINERDIISPSGKNLTLMNPAYMLRQIFEIAGNQYGVKGHITSLNPIRPENKADKWETEALKKFQTGEQEYSSIVQIGDEKYLRFMHAMVTEQRCLKCHAAQGYKLGDIRGGISTSVPLKKYYQIAKGNAKNLIIFHGAIFLVVLILSYIGYRIISREIIKKSLYLKQIKDREAQLQLQNKEYAALNEEYKIQNEELYSAKEKAEENDRLKTAFLNNMSHEIRTPLNAIIGGSELITRSGLSEEKYSKFSRMLKEGSSKLLQIISDVIEISQIHTNQTKVNLASFDFKSLVQEVILDLENKAKEKNLTFILETNDNENAIPVFSDFHKLKKILFHLLDNAIKFTHKGSVGLKYESDKDKLFVTVWDTGIGISPDKQQIIFEPFRQESYLTSGNYGGTGLGLSLIRHYCELLHGKLDLFSEAGNGTRVRFFIPINPIHSEKPSRVHINKPMSITKILVVEDDILNYQYLVELLDGVKAEILYAENGEIAVEICNRDPDINLVLMDIKMPVMDGVEAAKLIKKMRPDLPVVAQTAYANETDLEKFSKIFDFYITKPISSSKFTQLLSTQSINAT